MTDRKIDDIPGWLAIALFVTMFADPACDKKQTHSVNLDYKAAEVGRYQMMQLGSSRADQFLVDTKTGRVWRGVCAGDKNCQGMEFEGVAISPAP